MNLAKLSEFGIKATVTQAGKLHLEAPKGVITPELRQEIAQNRDFLLAEVNMVNIGSYCLDSPARHIQAANDVHKTEADPDRHCWPHSEDMNTAEISAMATRLATFARLGLPVDQAEKLADKLLTRDRDPDDDRHLCLECQHCHYGRCSNNEAAGLRHPELGRDYALALKRCNGFTVGNGTLAQYQGAAA